MLLEKAGDLLFIGTGVDNGTLRIYDTVAEAFLTGLNGDPNADTVSGLGQFSAFGAFLAATTQDGDFDGDGDVDGNDFLKWQRDDKTQAGLADWNTNYGTGVAAGAAAAAGTVPEPSAVALISVGAAAHWMRRRRRF